MSRKSTKDIEKIAENSRIDKLEDSLENHKSIISIIPTLGITLTLVGAIPQILELVKLGNGYLRYFSATQLLADSLTVITIPMFLICFLGAIQLRINAFTEGEKIDWLIISGILVINFVGFVIGKLSLNYSILWFLIITLIYLLILQLKEQVLYIIQKILKLIRVIVILGIIFWICISLAQWKDITSTSNLINLQQLESKISTSGTKASTKYVNDKYIFLEIKNNSGTFIEIRPFEDLFTSNPHTNSGQTNSTP